MNTRSSSRTPAARFLHPGFTLVELLVSMAILLLLILVVFQVAASTTSIWHNSTGAISNYQAARNAFTTINTQVSRATLKTYLDYINDPSNNNSPYGQFRTSLSASQQQSFVPFGYARASELHFVCGPAAQVIPNGTAVSSNLAGDAIFFQTPLGTVSTSNYTANKYLQHALNDAGFYIQYSDLAPSQLPGWLSTFFGAAHHYNFRLVRCVEPTESLSIYQKETTTGTYNLSWIPNASAQTFPAGGTTYNESVMAEGVVLLIVRPRLEPTDEQAAAVKVGVTYDATTQNSIISPNYVYDSRAWQTGYTTSNAGVKSSSYALLMRNQLPPIVDIALVCLDPTSVIRLNLANQATPPAILQPAASLFVNSANLDADLTTYGQQLTTNRIRFRVFRSSVLVQSAAWVNE